MANIGIDQVQLKKVLKRLTKLGAGIEIPLSEGIDNITELVANHAKKRHFFVGVGKGSASRAMGKTFIFKNPDGSPRFKVRTNNLLRSIQTRKSKVARRRIEGSVFAGMKYAKLVEEGGMGRQAYPFMRPAAEAIRPKANLILKKTINAFIRRFRAKGR